MKSFFIPSLFLSILFLNACSEDSFQQVKEIKLPAHQRLLAVQAIFSTQDTVLELYLSHSKSTLDSDPFGFIEGAAITLSSGNGTAVEFSPTKDSVNGIDSRFKWDAVPPPGFFLPGERYTLSISAPGYTTLTAEEIFPIPPDIDLIHFEQNATIDEYGDAYDQLDFELKDPSGANFYLFTGWERDTSWRTIRENGQVVGRDTFEFINKIYLSSIGPTIKGTRFGLVLSDEGFNAASRKTVLQRLVTRYPPPETYDFYFLVSSISKSYYQWMLSVEKAKETDGNPFAEPTIVSNNINNGFGVFALTHTQQFRIKKQ